MLSKHDPNFEQKRFDYIAETGLDPVTGKEADEELQNYATNYTKYAPSIKAGYDFLMVGTVAWSTRAYNKDVQTQRADAQINEYYQIKDAVRTQTVVPAAEVNTGIPKLNYSSLPDNAQNSYNEYTKVGWEGNFKGQTEGTAAGKKFRNADNVLPATDQHKTPITYKEFDVNNKLPSQGRDGERFVRGSDGSVYYTEDHYKTFKKIE